MEKEKLLDILAHERVYGALEQTMRDSAEYQSAQREHDIACDKLDEVKLDKRQSKAVDRVLSTANNCGAVYGAIAYRKGLDDGVRLTTEIKEVCLKKTGQK